MTAEALRAYQLLKPPLLCVSTLFAKFGGRIIKIKYQSHLALLPLIGNGKSASKRRSLLMACLGRHLLKVSGPMLM